MFGRIRNLFKGALGTFLSGVERRHPEALLEVEQENLRKQAVRFNNSLAAQAGLIESLAGQVRRLEGSRHTLQERIAVSLEPGNRTAAKQYVLRLQTIERELDENRRQLPQAELTYREMVRARDAAFSDLFGFEGLVHKEALTCLLWSSRRPAAGLLDRSPDIDSPLCTSPR